MSYSKLLLNGCEVEKTFNMTKFCIFYSYPMVYYLPYYDKLFKKIAFKNQIWPYSNSFLNRKELEKTFLYEKVAHFP